MALKNLSESPQGLTFDDVLLVPAYSEVLPNSVVLKSKFSRNIAVNAPVVSSAMDTVTEHRLAIAIAQQGGIGVIHKNLSILEQAIEVRKVKRSESGMIIDPITLPETAVVADALAIMQEHSIGGIPVVDALSWIMGEQGAKSLRGGKMEDVIFAGTSGRAPLGRAEVSVTIDNTDGALPIDFTEVTISLTF